MPKEPQQTIGDKTFKGVAKLIKLLPTGTVFLFKYLSPVLTNNGHCYTINKHLSGALVILCALSCFFSCFTDSYNGRDGIIHYGIVTKNGLWPFADLESGDMDLSGYKLRMGDFAHAVLSMIVFGVVAVLDPNTTSCFYQSFELDQKTVLMVLPPVVGALSSFVLMVFPNERHGIGYAASAGTAGFIGIWSVAQLEGA